MDCESAGRPENTRRCPGARKCSGRRPLFPSESHLVPGSPFAGGAGVCSPTRRPPPPRGRLQHRGTRNYPPPPAPAGSAAALRFCLPECLTAAGRQPLPSSLSPPASALQGLQGLATPGADTCPPLAPSSLSPQPCRAWRPPASMSPPRGPLPCSCPPGYLSARHQLLELTPKILHLCGRTRTQRYLSWI